MRAEYELPEDVEARVEGRKLVIRGSLGEVERDFTKMPLVRIGVEGKKVVLEIEGEKKKQKRMLNTALAHVRNMVTGVKKGYRYKLAIVHVHFPMRVKVQGDEIIIENFLGEKTPRKTWKYPDVNVKVEGKEIIVEGLNIEHVGQTAANIEQATRVSAKDRRIFRDGIYLVERGFMHEEEV